MKQPLPMIRRISLPVLLALCVCSGFALNHQGRDSQWRDPQTVGRHVRAYRLAHERAIVDEFIQLLSIPNIATDRINIARNAELIVAMLQRRGVRTRLLQVDGSPPVVFGELPAPGAQRTVAVYAHYDGQPVDPSEWAGDPWKPILRDKPLDQGGKEIAWPVSSTSLDGQWRLYGRSTSDDKAPIIAWLVALDALRAAAIAPSINLKFFFEGEEEVGSPHLRTIMEKYADLLRADVWLLCDGPVHQTRRLQLFFGARGITGVELTVYGPTRPLHSGHYGNWAPNPGMVLAHLLASMRDMEGRIQIAGFYDDVRPTTPSEQRALAEAPDIDDALRRELGLARTENHGARLVDQIMLPALNLRGIRFGQVGDKATNAIQTEAHASIDFRLVPNQTPEKVRARVEAHIRQQGFFIVGDTPDAATRQKHAKLIRVRWSDGYPPARTPMDAPAARAVIQTIEEATTSTIIKLPTLGGSVPMYLFTDLLNTPVIGLPIANHDNNQHAANENIRLQNLWDGIEVFAHLLARLGVHWQ